MYVDPGTENIYFKNLDAIIDLHEILDPIDVDLYDKQSILKVSNGLTLH